MKPDAKIQALGPLHAAAVYPLEVFRSLMGLNAAALRTARRNGLKVRRCGRRGYILGDDWISYLKSLDPGTSVASR